MSDERTTTGFDEPQDQGRPLGNLRREPPAEEARNGGSTALVPQEMGLADGGATGMEDLRQDEVQMPGLRIVQSNSPQLKRQEPEYNPDAKDGDILNTATGEVYPGEQGVEVVVFGRSYHYGMWLPRNADGSGGGFRGMVPAASELVQGLLKEHGRFKKLPWTNEADEDVELVETGQLYVYYGAPPLAAEAAQLAYVGMSSTMMPTYTRWATRHSGWKYRQPDGSMREAKLHAYVWRLTTAYQSRGTQSWYIFKLDLANARPLDSLTAKQDRALYGMAEEMFDKFAAGQVTAAPEERQPGEDEVPM